ncbi:hypothetical protein [Methylobacterium frigidaeris]|uniref:Uncharacterized protein n=1 Tax=Methylobacterium frigidaeris TaxID=2038277 RepID=A0AA37H8Z2_9HYPH|nr:hypothetical protein [Methylobacterium frigidaeris]PIK72000.1 hypothetical protein CS379_16370 [Methylobacterium frigidaeris]GJD60975.1 hypothetical protein MPEAHAMD_1115 [Methylobacterium frigidaeris]
MRALLPGAVIGVTLVATPAVADWRYCLARGPDRTVYLSAPFSTVAAMPALDAAFGRMLDRTKRPHHPVQCPRADDAASLRAMRLTALRYNRQDGETVVELDWTPDRDAAAKP